MPQARGEKAHHGPLPSAQRQPPALFQRWPALSVSPVTSDWLLNVIQGHLARPYTGQEMALA